MSPAERRAVLQGRIATAAASGLVARWAHLTRNPRGQPVEIHCKGCGLLIRVLRYVRVGRHQVVRVSTPMPDYQEMVLEMAEGPGRPPSQHVTHVCRGCAARPWPREALEAFFLCDVATWIGNPEAAIDPGLQGLILAQATRSVTGWRGARYASESPHRGGDPLEEAVHAG